MKRVQFLIAIALLMYSASKAAPGTITPFIRLDQFGYFPISTKVAVIADPQTGYNAAQSFSPSLGANKYQVRRWSDDAVMFSGTLEVWNGGATHAQSGDKGWWFDFSTVTATGSYYIYDVDKNVGSYKFEISKTVYDEVMKQAVRTYFYQRINYAKTTPYVDAKWADAACFEGANQDRHARKYTATTDATTERDLSGGWFDAGDYNKYVPFTFRAVGSLLETFRLHPAVFKDDYNIPESGNGIPDLLDEVKWEMDWLIRMQDGTDNDSGLLMKVGVIDYNSKSPPSTDPSPRYYVPECTSSTITGAALFALGSIVYKSLGKPTMTTYGIELLERAKKAWGRAKTTTKNFTYFEQNCDDGTVKSGDADLCWDSASCYGNQIDMAIAAAAYLYEATGENEYKTYFDTTYRKARPSAPSGTYTTAGYWGPYTTVVQRAMLRYARLPGVDPTVASNIITQKSNNKNIQSTNDYTNKTDLYRAHMNDNEYTWGSNEFKANGAIHNYDYVDFAVDPTNNDKYKEAGESYLHWYHGVNPMGIVQLSNMYAYGADSCANEIYHVWFGEGTPYDHAKTSVKGPAPGYVICGPNKNYAREWYGLTSITPPYNQPPQKSYKDWNTSWNNAISRDEASWSINEPTIYGQAAYVGLLARVISSHAADVSLPLHFTYFTVAATALGSKLNWVVSEINNLKHFVVERSFDGRIYTSIYQVPVQLNQLKYTFIDTDVRLAAQTIYYRIRAVYPTEEKLSAVRKIAGQVTTTFSVSPNPASTFIWANGSVKEESLLVIFIVDASGIILQKEQWTQPAGEFSKYVSIEKLPAGTYWVRMQTPDGMKTEKIVKR